MPVVSAGDPDPEHSVCREPNETELWFCRLECQIEDCEVYGSSRVFFGSDFFMIRHTSEAYRWKDIDVFPYKEDGTIFKSVTRQTLFHGADDLGVELRYFEVGVDGHTTLERHQHAHLVTIIRGSGHVLVGNRVSSIGPHDVVHIPPFTWHQFRATNDEALGFLCIVNPDRDRPQRPGPIELLEINSDDQVARFVRV